MQQPRTTQEPAPTEPPVRRDAAQASADPQPPAASQAVEVVALYGDTPQKVVHFQPQATRRPRFSSWLLLGAGLLLTAGGVLAFGSQILSVRHQKRHRSEVMAFIQERGLPQKFAPRIKTRPVIEASGAGAFALGMVLLILGAIRIREERAVPSFTIGEDPRATFHTPSEGLPSARFPLVSTSDSGFQVHFLASMQGQASRPDAAPLALADLARLGIATPLGSPGSYAWRLPPGGSIQLDHGGARFEIRMVEPGEPLAAEPLPRRTATLLSTPLSVSLLGSAGVLGLFLLLMQVRPSGGDLLEADPPSGRVTKQVRALTASSPRDRAHPKRKQPRARPRPTRTKQPNTHLRGVASRRDDRLRRPTRGAAGPASGAGVGRQQGRHAGMLGVLQSSNHRMASLFGTDTSLTREQDDSLGALLAHTYAGNNPLAGLGLDGGGRAGGTSGAGGDPLGSGWCGTSCGIGGGGVFGGPGGIPGGVPIGPGIPNRNPHDPKVFLPHGHAEVTSIDPATLRRIIRRHLSQVRYCYVSVGLPNNPRLSGLLKIAFLISPQGRVTRAQVASSTLHHPPTESCIVAQIRTWKFPKLENQSAYVVYPFRFRPSGSR